MPVQLNRHVIIYLLTAIGLISLPHALHLPTVIFLYFSGLLCWRFAALWNNHWLPGRLLIFLLTVSGFLLLFLQHGTLLGRDAGSSLFLIALGLKLMELKTTRDLYLLTYLAFIVAAAQFLFLQNILMAAYILLVSCALLGTLIRINSPHQQTLATLKTAAAIILQAIPLMLVLFVFFPRLEAPRWLLFSDNHTARSGLSDSLEPGSISTLGMSDELVFRVRFEGDIPPPELRYWRGPVYTNTDGKRWTLSQHQEFNLKQEKPVFSGKAYRYTLMIEPQDRNWVYALDMPKQYPVALTRNASYQLTSTASPGQRTEYAIISYPQYNTGKIPENELRAATQLPGKPSANLTRLVNQLKGSSNDPEHLINRILQHFREQDFYYTLRPPLMGEKPIENFLFNARSGFCSHYATAFVILLRVAGIPSRVVGGYQGGRINKVGNFMEIRQANAHAWSEVWLDNRGWVRIDPTTAIAPERIEQDVNIDLQIASGEINFSGNAFSWMNQANLLWHSIDYNWQHWVINFNSSRQSSFLSSLGIQDLQTMAIWLAVMISGITLGLSLLLFCKRNKTTDQALLIYNRFCRKLAKAGIQKKAGEGAKSFAARVKHNRPDLVDEIDAITARYHKIRYGKSFEFDELQQFNKSVSEFKV